MEGALAAFEAVGVFGINDETRAAVLKDDAGSSSDGAGSKGMEDLMRKRNSC